MRLWDIHPGYLNRQSLLGEHRELHGLVSIIVHGKNGYAHHPETRRWFGYGWALKRRHDLLVAEMIVRGYHHRSPVRTRTNKDVWPSDYIDEPSQQLQILQQKYQGIDHGRIPLPKNAQQLWSHHKYSVLARNQALYRRLGQEVSKSGTKQDFARLAKLLTEQLRQPPPVGDMRNALQHMWGHVSDQAQDRSATASWSLSRLLKEIQQRVHETGEPYLASSTALSELAVWIPTRM